MKTFRLVLHAKKMIGGKIKKITPAAAALVVLLLRQSDGSLNCRDRFLSVAQAFLDWR